MSKKRFNMTEDWLLEKGYSKNPDGSWQPPSVKSAYIKQQKEKVDIPAPNIDIPIATRTFCDYGYAQKPLAVFDVTPIGKPRMTQRDKWGKRKNVQNYWRYKDALLLQAKNQNFVMPESGYHIIAVIPVPHSWKESKKHQMIGSPHKQKPDKDNIEKGILDALLEEDSGVWDGRITKYWGRAGQILIYAT